MKIADPFVALAPQPARLELRGGQFVLSEATVLETSPGLEREAAQLADRLRRATGFSLKTGGPAASVIRLFLDDALSPASREGYRLTVKSNGIELAAPSSAGIFHGIQTLFQLFPPAIYDAVPQPNPGWAIPQLLIEDSPRFSWRGALLDCSRHFHPVEYILKFIDLLALHKLNVFHWHLTDDQGWRIEIRKYPRLTEIGAWRRGTWRGHALDGVPHGGFYSQEQIRHIVRHATDRHVAIVPEIEMPGHAQAAIAAYPELGCTAEKLEPWTTWGVSENIFHPGEKTVLFLQDVLREVMELFPGNFIHLGGDEAVKTQWQASADVQALLSRVGAKNNEELQGWFMKRMDHFLAEHGRRMVGWDEILEGGLAPGATVMSWRGMEGGIAAAKRGHDVVMASNTHTYFDYYQSQDRDREPPAIGGFIPLRKVYEFEPVPAELSPGEKRHILGVQGQLWSEHLSNGKQVEYQAFPRLAALADVAWSPPEGRDYDLFLRRWEKHRERLDRLGVNYRPIDDESHLSGPTDRDA